MPLNQTLTLNARDAAIAADQEVRRMNGSRVLPRISAMHRNMMEQFKLYIFNVGPFMIPRYMGSTGTFVVKPCAEGAEYSEPLEISGVVPEYVIKNEHSMEIQWDDGEYVANQIVGIGQHLKPQDSLEHRGVFVSKTNPPSEADVARAREKLNKYFQMLVNEMNDAYSMGPTKVAEVRTPDHFIAARALKLTEAQAPWLSGSQAPASRALCPGCGTPYVVGILKCGHTNCGWILDRPGYEAAVEAGHYGEEELEKLNRRRAKQSKN